MLMVISIVLSAILFLVAWIFAVKFDNYSLVDAVWAAGIGIIGLFWLSMSHGLPKHWAVAILLLAWSVRLTWHLQRRIRKHHPTEDSRYVKLRETWKGKMQSSFFWFFQAQGLSVVLLALPFVAVARDSSNAWGLWESLGLLVALTGIVGEGVADGQMSAYKSENPDPKGVCRRGLWRYSRHPNYFFEGVIWLGFYFFACGSEFGWATIHAPALIIFLLLKVTGIPPTEEAALARKGEAYRIYQKTTSAFIPLPPRN